MPLTDDVPVRRKHSVRAAATELRVGRILDAAARRYADQGYTATSLREVAADVGLSPAGLIHHFPDRAALLEAVLDARLGGAGPAFGLDDTDGDSFVRGLIDIARRDAQDPAQLRLICVLSTESLAPSHPAHGYFQQWYRQIRRHHTAAFENLAARGRFIGPLIPREAAIQVCAARDGIHVQWLMAPDEVDLVAEVRHSFAPYVDLAL